MLVRHNESRDLNIDLLKMTGLSQLIREAILKVSDSDGKGGLRLDWGSEVSGNFRGKHHLISVLLMPMLPLIAPV